MRNFTLLLVSLMFCACAVKHPQIDVAKLQEAKHLFESQIKDGIHPVIWVYLDEHLHDPDSFRLQRFEYTIGDYNLRMSYEAKKYLFGKETMTQYGDFVVFAYKITMLYRAKVPSGGLMRKQMTFYLLKDKNLILPNRQLVSLTN